MINLLYCGNSEMFDGVMLSLMSIAEKTKTPFCAYIMTMDLTHINENYCAFEQRHIDILNEVVRRESSENEVKLIDATEVFLKKMEESPNMTSGYTPYALLRLLSHKFDLPDKILYLDTDIMLLGDINEITDYDIADYEFAGVIDRLGKRFINKDYINTGVLYLNIERIRETGLFDKALERCLMKEMPFPDQDAINELVQKKLILPTRFNEQFKLKKDTLIQHFCKSIRFLPFFKVINVKQWQIELVHKTLKIRVYDCLYERFKRLRDELGADFLKPLRTYKPLSFFGQLRYSFSELRAYSKQNKGIFRKNKKSS